MADDQNISASGMLMETMFLGLDHALKLLSQKEGTFVPFVMVNSTEGKELRQFNAGNFDDSVAQAKAYVDDLPDNIKGYAIVFDGFVTKDNVRREAIIIESGEEENDEGYIVAQCYQRTNGVAQMVDAPVYIGQAQKRLTQDNTPG